MDNARQFLVPAVEGPHHLRLFPADNKQTIGPGVEGPGTTIALKAEVRMAGDVHPLATFTDLGPFPFDF